MNMNKIQRMIVYILVGIILVVFVNRLFYTVSFYDEVGNIALAYRVVLGQVPLVDIWEFQQTGDFFAIPFVYLFYLMTGGMDGIVLFMRLSYLLVNCIVALVLYNYIKKYMEKNIAVLICLCVVTYAPFSLYYLWYDTCAILLMLVGGVLILKSLKCEQAQSRNKYLFLAGIMHACMCYAYPSFLAVVIVYLGLLIFENKKLSKLSGYIIGGCSIALVFLLFVVSKYENIFFFNGDITERSLAARTYSLVERVYGILYGSVYYFKTLILESVVLGYIFVKCKKCKQESKKNVLKIVLIIAIIAVPIKKLLPTGSLAIFLYFFWLFVWGLLLFQMLSKEKKKIAIPVMKFLYFPAIISYFMVGFTAYGGGVKSTFGVYTGSVSVLFIIGLILTEVAEYFKNKISGNKLCGAIVGCLLLIPINNVFMFYNTGFEGQNFYEATYKMQTGVFKGIYTKESHKVFEDIEVMVNNCIGSQDETIIFFDGMQCGYLYTDLLPTVPSIWKNYISRDIATENDWELLKKYWETIDYPDIIVCKKEYMQQKPVEFVKMLEEYYTVAGYGNGIIVYSSNAR